MRFKRLDLTRFGCFTEYHVDFGERDATKPDFHLIYGLNESGKSTLFAAVLDLLFGIEQRSSYNFLHDYGSMRIGGLLEIGGEIQELVRIKRENGLLGPDEQPLAETVLTRALGSIDRESYTTMFSLDDDSLESGGESILESQGDLGTLLFAAASGLSEVSRQLDEIKSEVDEIYRPRATATAIGVLKRRLGDLKKEQKELDLSTAHYADLVRASETARTAHATAKKDLDQMRVELARCRRLFDALPMWDSLKGLRRRLSPLQDLPDAPAGWSEEIAQLSPREASSITAIKNAEDEITRLSGELKEVVVDEAILPLEGRLKRLKEEESRYRTATDIPQLQDEASAVQERIAACASRVGRPECKDPSTLLLDVGATAELNGLIETCSKLSTQLESARSERDLAHERVREASKAIEGLDQADDVKQVEIVLASVRAQDPSARLEHLGTQSSKQAEEIEAALLTLRPWQGDLAGLVELAVPESGRIACWQTDRSAAREEETRLTRKLAELGEERERIAAAILQVKKSTGAIDDEQAAAARKARDEAWKAHRSILDGSGETTEAGAGERMCATAITFKSAMSEYDRLVDLRSGQTEDITRLRLEGERLAKTNASYTHVQQQLEAMRAQLAQLNAEIDAALAPLGLPGDMELVDLQRWLERKEAALKLGADLRSTELDIRAATDNRTAAQAKLIRAMTDVAATPGDGLSLSELMAEAQRVINEQKQRSDALAARKESLEKEQRDHDLRRAPECQAAEQAVLKWQENWTGLLAGSWLCEGGSARAPEEVREILKELSALPGLIEKCADLKRRIQSMCRDQERFVKSGRSLATEAGVKFAEDDVLGSFDELHSRLSDASKQAGHRASKKTDLDRAEKSLREAKQALSAIDRRRAKMADLFGVTSLAELQRKIGDAEKKASLVEQIESSERNLVTLLWQPTLTAAEQMLAEVSTEEEAVQTRDLETTALTTRVGEKEDEVNELHHAFRSKESSLAELGGDAAVARLEEEQRTVLLEIQEQAERYLRLKIGVAAAEQAMHIYRDRHRSSMMKRSGVAFRTITRGRYQDLTTTPGKHGDILVGIRAAGGSLLASEMSKGTRFQLYLALRLAGYCEFAKFGETLPFIADDIMETFDDDRTAEAFQLLAGMAEQGQVIYLTHHAHLRDIAREVCGDGVRVHELPPAGGVIDGSLRE